MVPTINIVSMALCIIVCLAAVAVPYVIIHKKSSKLETGLPGALGYGFIGYIWQYIFYMFAGLAIIKGFQTLGDSTGMVLLASVCASIASTFFTILSIYWGIYLTNQKQRSIYRSAVVGIGFALGKIALDVVYSYGTSIYVATLINKNGLNSSSDFQKSIVNTSAISLIGGAYKCLLMIIIILAMTLIMGRFYLAKQGRKAVIFGAVVYEGVTLLNLFVNTLFGKLAASIIIVVLLTIIAVFALGILLYWFRTDEVDSNPLRYFKWKKEIRE